MIDFIYINSPRFIQNLLISVKGFITMKQRYGKTYQKSVLYYKNKDYSSFQKEQKDQEKQFLEFLDFTANKSNFYKEIYKDLDLTKIKSLKDIAKLPIISKEDIRSNLDKIYTIKSKDGLTFYTGGTTGKSLKVIFTKDDFQKRMAYLDAYKYSLGVPNLFEIRKATFSGRPLVKSKETNFFWRDNYFYKQRLYSTFHINEGNLPIYINNLNEYKPVIINGFVSAIYEIASYILRHDIEIHSPFAIFTTSEALLDEHRNVISEAFKCKVYNQYASSEGAPFITECIEGNLHYNIDTGIIETDDNNNMIITSFTTHGTPLIRYNIEDGITFKDGNCSCGSSHPLVENIEGRKVDYLYASNKNKVSLSHLADVIKGLPNSIIKMQFIQNEMNIIDVKIVVDPKTFIEKHKAMIIKEMSYRFGKNTKFIIGVVGDIPREKSGKYRIIKNNIKHLSDI
jgi:phenylacetate-CoA ligase